MWNIPDDQVIDIVSENDRGWFYRGCGIFSYCDVTYLIGGSDGLRLRYVGGKVWIKIMSMEEGDVYKIWLEIHNNLCVPVASNRFCRRHRGYLPILDGPPLPLIQGQPLDPKVFMDGMDAIMSSVIISHAYCIRFGVRAISREAALGSIEMHELHFSARMTLLVSGSVWCVITSDDWCFHDRYVKVGRAWLHNNVDRIRSKCSRGRSLSYGTLRYGEIQTWDTPLRSPSGWLSKYGVKIHTYPLAGTMDVGDDELWVEIIRYANPSLYVFDKQSYNLMVQDPRAGSLKRVIVLNSMIPHKIYRIINSMRILATEYYIDEYGDYVPADSTMTVCTVPGEYKFFENVGALAHSLLPRRTSNGRRW
jgi:hypothetical protein